MVETHQRWELKIYGLSLYAIKLHLQNSEEKRSRKREDKEIEKQNKMLAKTDWDIDFYRVLDDVLYDGGFSPFDDLASTDISENLAPLEPRETAVSEFLERTLELNINDRRENPEDYVEWDDRTRSLKLLVIYCDREGLVVETKTIFKYVQTDELEFTFNQEGALFED